jgi:hypothetical protein
MGGYERDESDGQVRSHAVRAVRAIMAAPRVIENIFRYGGID